MLLNTYIVLLGLLPSTIWLFFFSREDSEKPEPLPALLYAFILGAILPFVALFIQLWVNGFFQDAGILITSPLAIGVFSAIEEMVKFLAVLLVVSHLKDFDEPLDAMIYMITVALGFAATENIGSLFSHGDAQYLLSSGKAFEVLILRFIGATLLHALASAIIGFHWAVVMMHRKWTAVYLPIGILIAILLHGVFNYLIIETGPASWALVFLVFISFFVLIDFEKIKELENL